MENLELLEPERLYKSQLKDQHHERVEKYLDDLVKKSQINKEENRATCDSLYHVQAEIKQLNTRLGRSKFLRVLCIIMIILGAFFGVLGGIVIASGNGLAGGLMIGGGVLALVGGILLLALVYKKKARALNNMLDMKNKEADQLKKRAQEQMMPLWVLIDEQVPAKLFHETAPLIEMDRLFDIQKYEFLKEQYGYQDINKENRSILGLQSGSILGNPFIFYKELEMNMVPHRYEGTLVITYTTTIRTSQGTRTVTRTQTLHAYVTKPRPEYSTDTYLMYANEAAPRLSFSRNHSNINSYDEKGLEKYVRKHEKDLTDLANKQMKKGGTYTPLGNPEFELFFGGLDRDNEVEYRLLFTPLAQKSMLSLMKSNVGYGDDFTFKKRKMLNFITSVHSQGNALFCDPKMFYEIDYEVLKDKFISYNDNYFKSIFFDLAPLLSIPLYQQHKAHSYIYKGTVPTNFTRQEHEAIANRFDPKSFAHPDSKTQAILKTTAVKNGIHDSVCVTAHTFDAIDRVDLVPVMGGDGRMHSVPVHWYEYIPLTQDTNVNVDDIGGDRVKFNSLGNNNMIFNRGLVSYNQDEPLNISIEELKAKMAKE